VDAVMQTLDGSTWAEGMALSVSDTVPTDTEGQVGDVVFVSGPSPGNIQGKILQVVSASYGTQTSTTSATYVSTGLTATITPSSSTSKILVMASGTGQAATTGARAAWAIFRGAGWVYTTGSQVWMKSSAGGVMGALSCIGLDSPDSTSAQVYTLGMVALDGGTTYTQMFDSASVITLMEVEA
jgi:hypothetical protein